MRIKIFFQNHDNNRRFGHRPSRSLDGEILKILFYWFTIFQLCPEPNFEIVCCQIIESGKAENSNLACKVHCQNLEFQNKAACRLD